MRSTLWPLVVVVAVGLSGPARAGIGIFSRKPKGVAAEQVPALVMQLKTDKDDSRRASAAEELRAYDPKAYPEMMTVLTDALLKDASSAVRSEAASTIARLRPINQQAGFALEQAASNDPALRVRMAARQALWQYHLVGYRSGRPPEAADAKRGPQLPPPPHVATKPGQPHVVAKNPRTGAAETPEPPLADAPPASPPAALPPTLLTPPPARPAPAPKAKGQSEGPALPPPA
jgi:hypothetical protein